MLFWLLYFYYLCTVETYYYCKRVCDARKQSEILITK